MTPIDQAIYAVLLKTEAPSKGEPDFLTLAGWARRANVSEGEIGRFLALRYPELVRSPLAPTNKGKPLYASSNRKKTLKEKASALRLMLTR